MEDSNGDFAVNTKFNLPDVPYQISSGYYNSAPNIAPNLTDATGFTIVSALQGGGNSGYSSYNGAAPFFMHTVSESDDGTYQIVASKLLDIEGITSNQKLLVLIRRAFII